MEKPFDLVAERPISENCRANREHWKTLLGNIYEYFSKNPLLIPDTTIPIKQKATQKNSPSHV